MSLTSIRAGVARALAYLADPSLSYRVGTSGAWLAFTGGVLNTDLPIGVAYDDDEGGETQIETGLLVCLFTSETLTIGDQIKDHQGNGWAVLGVERSVAAVMYRVKRTRLGEDSYGPSRPGGER